MITVFHILVGIFFVLTVAFFWDKKHKILILGIGLLTAVICFYAEFIGIDNSVWTWFNSGGGFLEVPYIVIITYFLAGMVMASLVLSPKAKQIITKNYYAASYFILIPTGIIYALFTKDLALLALVTAVFLYSKLHKEAYFLQISTMFAAGDLVAENILIALGHIKYTNGYTSAIYLGFFAGSMLILSLTEFIAKKLEETKLK